jgi:putative ABC transport system ATP-binding protein
MLLQAKELTKKYILNNKTVVALNKLDLDVKTSDFLVINGPSGCGKSSLLMMLGGLLNPTSGTITYLEKQINNFNKKEKRKYHEEEIGFVFQRFYLFPYLTLLDNILFAINPHQNKGIIVDKIKIIASRLKIENRLNHKPNQVSMGEAQRAALIRALIKSPNILIADEPTGNLDKKNTALYMDFLREYNSKNELTIILATHEPEFNSVGNKTLML